MEHITQNVKSLEAALGKVVAATRDLDLLEETGLDKDEDVQAALGLRAVWSRVEELVKAEETYRQNAAAAARHRGVETATLEIQQGEEPGEMRFILVVPGAKRFQEDRLMVGFQMAINNIVGSMLVEQEMTKLSIMRLLQLLGSQLATYIERGDSAKLEVTMKALATMDGKSIAALLNTLTIATGLEEQDVDATDG